MLLVPKEFNLSDGRATTLGKLQTLKHKKNIEA